MKEPLPRAVAFLAGLLENGTPEERSAAKVVLPVCRAARAYILLVVAQLPESQAAWLAAALEELRSAVRRVGGAWVWGQPAPSAIATLADLEERAQEHRRDLCDALTVCACAREFISWLDNGRPPLVEGISDGHLLAQLRSAVSMMEAR